jgi:hypothetical protein
MVGLGGVLVEALGDVVLAPVPLNIVAARALLDRLKGAQIFGPFRGLPLADTEALADLMVRLAQFAADHARQREVTAERIRDKISASKRKGLWVGGMVPLGYESKGRKITVNDAELGLPAQ